MLEKKISRRSFLTVSAMTAAALAVDWDRIAACAEKMGPGEDYPTVIIGAGLGGLTCGAFLAKQGMPVTVVEQNVSPGGYATSFSRRGGRYTFEVSLQGTSLQNNSSARVLQRLALLDKVDVVPLPEVARIKTPALDLTIPQRDPEACIRLLGRYFPDESDGIRGLVEKMVAVSSEADRIHQNRGKFFRPLFPVEYPNMWGVRNQTAGDLIDGFIRSQKLKYTLTALWGNFGLPPSMLSGFYFASGVGDYLKNGCFYIKPRAQTLSNLLAACIQAHGGRILYQQRVQNIRMENNAVSGVGLAGGEILPARAVVSNASAPVTFGKMLPRGAVPVAYLEKINQFRPSISSFIVWLGLNREIGDRVKAFGTSVSRGGGPEADYNACMRGDIKNCSYRINVYDNVYEGYSPPGSSTLQLLAHCGYDPWRRFEADYRRGEKVAYRRQKDRWSNLLIARAQETVSLDLFSMIDVKVVATPLTNWRYTGNTEGAIYGYEQSMNNAFINRLGNRTPVRGLYLASAWGSPGGGYRGVLWGGESTFRAMMQDWSETGTGDSEERAATGAA